MGLLEAAEASDCLPFLRIFLIKSRVWEETTAGCWVVEDAFGMSNGFRDLADGSFTVF